MATRSTARRGLDAIDEALLARLQAARAATRGGCGRRVREAIALDFDASRVNVHSDKESAPTYKRGFGYLPLLVFLDETSEALAAKLRP